MSSGPYRKNGHLAPSPQPSVADWEEWEDASITASDDEQGLVQQQPPPKPPSDHLRPAKATTVRVSRYSTAKIKRLKSRKRQKAQNAQAGISVITDMTAFRRDTSPEDQDAAKFADSAALRALEGEQDSASVGNWNWLKKAKEQSPSASSQINQSPHHGLSPDDRPIMIGISVPPSVAPSYDQNPYADRSHQLPNMVPKGGLGVVPRDDRQPQSFWSPDTPDTTQPFSNNRPASSVYSMAPSSDAPTLMDMPPVPSLPKQYQNQGKLISLELQGGGAEDDDAGTPCTLFEEDGTTPRSAGAARKKIISLSSAVSASRGWWDHVLTPLVENRMTLSSRKQKLDSPKEAKFRPPSSHLSVWPVILPKAEPVLPLTTDKTPIVRVPTPRRSPSPSSSAGPWQTSNSRVAQYISESQRNEKNRMAVTDEEQPTTDQPPPYSPPQRPQHDPIRYRAVFPPSHPLHAQFPPSPNPISPGLAATMTSQGATQMTDLRGVSYEAQLPARPVGTYLPPAHLVDAPGPHNRVERTRRRHEKEDMIARRAGGFWRGRCCIPASGCFGRTGREGRKKRRICLGVCSAVIVLIIVAIVLAVVLTRPRAKHEVPSIWVNLTDFPPMPTGILTVAGPDNTIARSVCTEPTTLWSCSLPKDDQSPSALYQPSQPPLIMQIQWDNSTRRAWKVPNEDAPVPVSRRAPGSAARAHALVQARAASQFKPDPAPPDFKDMWFLGETTDNIVSDTKAGEPAPFYISILKSLSDKVETPNLQRRDGNSSSDAEPPGSSAIAQGNITGLLPRPALEPDGTPAPAVLFPNVVQQPVRLYDRGLSTEHYGFYAHFQRTIFLKSVTVPNRADDPSVPLDRDGGCRKSEAKFLTTWGETRMLVRIWTRKLATNSSSIVQPDRSDGAGKVVAELRRPGTMPWPVTITLDTHGGDPKGKLVWETPMDDRMQLVRAQSKLLVNKMDAGGTWINPRGTGDAKYGGFDGGTGGCKSSSLDDNPPSSLPCYYSPSTNPTMRPIASPGNIFTAGSRLRRRHPLTCHRTLVTLAIETSCDDTAVAILEHHSSPGPSPSADRRPRTVLHFNERISSDLRAWRGVRPAAALDGHQRTLASLVRRALAHLPRGPPDFVCATRGPGIHGNLATGLFTAKGLALAWDVPLLGVHHMQAHALTPRLVRALSSLPPAATSPEFPFLTLLVSGGHSQLVLSAGLADHRVLATTADAAVGNVLDQTARVILPEAVLAAGPDVMYGRLLESYAFPEGQGDFASFYAPPRTRAEEVADEVDTGYAWRVPLPMRATRRMAYSFSAVHSAVHAIAARRGAAMDEPERRALARHTQRVAFQHLASRLCFALEDHPDARTLVVAGGVACNKFLMHVLRTTLEARGLLSSSGGDGIREIVAPPVELCTDNAAMIAWAGMEMYEAGWHSDLDVAPVAKWPLDPAVRLPGQAADGEGAGGLMGVGGWLRWK
ncbi:Peptidase M22, glycoprotease [Cordyceps fumosorosea ARSEF 2679]|uniref:N(6)-L-threonylcarbamoyladenine synthase n=1 Tax=Cordyceps fumosorosea (strain ARSEF 2679) TaxID=1081104 RepID=A0A167ZGY8_CORFA|nr:Peptidase M22, glycoprotease [Cordyceps fumosorosea ARSEF 2679]OAA67503.1 Peptidase M22, glycoprotease [Cordyceps fumosorosea ARSEF 2679]